jgi:photoactive yellow protein
MSHENRLPATELDLLRRLTAERDALRLLVGELRAEIEQLKAAGAGPRAVRGGTMQGLPRVDGFVPTPTPPEGIPSAAFTPRQEAASSGLRPASGRYAPAAAPPPVTRVAAPDQGIDFGAVARLSPEELDSLPYGLITLDARGRVIHYNDTESRMVGLPKERVIGRSFFGEIAPCTRVREFEGRFLELVKNPVSVRVQTFDFVFRFAQGEQQVTIVITPARTRGQYHLAILRRSIE